MPFSVHRYRGSEPSTMTASSFAGSSITPAIGGPIHSPRLSVMLKSRSDPVSDRS